MPQKNKPERFTIGEWTIRPSLDRLERDGQIVTIEPRAMAVLVYLAQNARKVIAPDELIGELWHGRVVDDNAVYKRIAQLRKALGDDAQRPRYIQTIPKQGYRLIASVAHADIGHSRSKRSVIYASVAGIALLIIVGTLFFLQAPPDVDDSIDSAQRALAVLPFADLSDSGDQAYLSEGISEELIHALSNVPGLRVAARTSAFTFRDGTADVATIGEKLNVDAILEGSVRKVGNQLRITVQLIDVRDGHHVWSKTFDREFRDLLSIQTEIAQAVAESISADPAAAVDQIAEVTTDKIDAYDFYLLGRHYLYQRTPTSVVRSTELFKNAIAADPDFAQAYAGLSISYSFQRQFTRSGQIDPSLDHAARNAAKRALAIDGRLSEAHLAIANVMAIEEDWTGAELAYRRAIELDPNDALARYWHSIALGALDRDEEAVAAIETAVRLDPLSPHINTQWAGRLHANGRIADATTHFEKAIALDPGYWAASWKLAGLKHEFGHIDDAIQILESFLAASKDEDKIGPTIAFLAEIHLDDFGDIEGAQQRLSQAGELQAHVAVMNMQIHVYLAENRYDEAAQLTHQLAAEFLETPYWVSIAALYEMIVSHDVHARLLYEQADAAPRQYFLRGTSNLFDMNDFGYMPAVNYAHILLKANDIDRANELLAQCRTLIADWGESQPWDYYVLSSIEAIEGDRKEALVNLRRAFEAGWRRHWFIVRDPNFVSLREDAEFRRIVEEIEADVVARSRRFNTLIAGKKEP